MPIVAQNKTDVKSSSPQFKVDERFPIAGVRTLSVGLGWELLRKGSVDLDASAVLFDQAGQFITSVYFGNLHTGNCPALGNKVVVSHSGDNRDGAGDGDDETVTVQLDQIPMNCKAIVFSVTSYNGDPFWGVQSAKLRMVDKSSGTELGHFSLAAGGGQTALMMAKLYRDAANPALWILHVIGQATDGRSFGDLLPLMQGTLKDIIPNVVVVPKPLVVVLAKGESLALGESGLKNLMCGLGWDKMGDQPIDLDAACVMFDRSQAMIDSVFFNRLTNDNGSVRHNGDNQTGEGEGDDEKIFMNLESVPETVDSMFLIVNSYKGDPFSFIKNAYMRVVDLSTNKEMVRFQLNGTGSVDHTALLMVKLYRYHDHVGAGAAVDEKAAAAAAVAPVSKKWMIKAVGYGAVGRMFKDNVKDCQQELIGKLRVNPNSGGFQYQQAAAAPAAHAAHRPAAQPAQPAAAAAPAQQENGCCVIA